MSGDESAAPSLSVASQGCLCRLCHSDGVPPVAVICLRALRSAALSRLAELRRDWALAPLPFPRTRLRAA